MINTGLGILHTLTIYSIPKNKKYIVRKEAGGGGTYL